MTTRSAIPRLEPPLRLVLQPRFEDYSFLTPRDMAGDTFTVTIRYRLDVFEPGGERVDGYVFTGYGREKSGGMSGTAPLLAATQRAMREAGAKLAVELPDEDTVRTLLAGETVAPRPVSRPGPHEALGSFGTAVPAPPPQEPAAPPPVQSTEDSGAAADDSASPDEPAALPPVQSTEDSGAAADASAPPPVQSSGDVDAPVDDNAATPPP